MAALAAQEVTTAWRSSAGSPATSARPCSSSQAKKSGWSIRPVLRHLGVAGQQLARRQGAQHLGVGQHQARLVEGADQVLALGQVDGGLAADRGIHLGQQRGGDLHEADAAQQDGGGEAGDVADHPAAQRDDQVAALAALFDQRAAEPLQVREVLGALAGRQHDGLVRDALRGEPGGERRQVQAGDRAVAHHEDPRPPQQRRDVAAGLGQQALADPDVVAPAAEFDRERLAGGLGGGRCGAAHAARPCRRASSADRMRSTAASGGPSSDTTVRSASA
jgi:hypothetical protein